MEYFLHLPPRTAATSQPLHQILVTTLLCTASGLRRVLDSNTQYSISGQPRWVGLNCSFFLGKRATTQQQHYFTTSSSSSNKLTYATSKAKHRPWQSSCTRQDADLCYGEDNVLLRSIIMELYDINTCSSSKYCYY